MVTTRKKTETVVVTLRIKEALRRRLEAAALYNDVSVNSEITRRLENSFTRAELTGLTENVDRLSGLYERARVSAERVEQYRQYATRCLEIAQTRNDPESKRLMIELASSWLKLAGVEQGGEATPDQEPELLPQSGPHKSERVKS